MVNPTLSPAAPAAPPHTVSETIDDATITARVMTALLNDPQVGATKIDVDTTNGIVTLSGTVKSQAEAARALVLAARGATDPAYQITAARRHATTMMRRAG